MEWQVWKKALELSILQSVIYASIVAAAVISGFAWWLRGHISKERIAALEERLRLAKEDQERLNVYS